MMRLLRTLRGKNAKAFLIDRKEYWHVQKTAKTARHHSLNRVSYIYCDSLSPHLSAGQ